MRKKRFLVGIAAFTLIGFISACNSPVAPKYPDGEEEPDDDVDKDQGNDKAYIVDFRDQAVLV